MSPRHRAREIAMQLLFQSDFQAAPPSWEEIETFVRKRLRQSPEQVPYCLRLIDGTLRNLRAIDRQIKDAASNWRLGRMLATDRNILRLAVFEMLFEDDDPLPAPIVIHEAVLLANRYGSSESSAFVNGVLSRIAQQQATAHTEPHVATASREPQAGGQPPSAAPAVEPLRPATDATPTSPECSG